jgi:hypothetical protein
MVIVFMTHLPLVADLFSACSAIRIVLPFSFRQLRQLAMATPLTAAPPPDPLPSG